MNHKITIEEAINALDQNIIVAASTSAKKLATKSLVLNRSIMKYEVKYRKTDTGEESKDEYRDLAEAVEKYNGYDV